MNIEKVDENRYKVKIITSLGEVIKIVHRSQLYWLTDEQLKDMCNKQLSINFDNKEVR